MSRFEPKATRANKTSDAKSPDEVVKQILQIHAILPGQKPDRQFNIPVRGNTQQSAQPMEPSAQQPVQPVAHQSAQPVQPVAHQSAQPVQSQHEPTPFQPVQSQQFREPPQPQQLQQSLQGQQLQQPPQPQQLQQPQHSQPDHSNPTGLDGATAMEPSRSLSKSKSSHPSTIPMQVPGSRTESVPHDVKEKIAQELPPSTLLHSNPKPEARKDDLLRRKDSETEETEEFHDAQS